MGSSPLIIVTAGTCAIPVQFLLRGRVGNLSNLVLRPGLEIAGVMTLMQLAGGIAPGAVDHAPALHRRSFGDGIGPALHVLVFVHGEEFTRAIKQPLYQT